MNFCLRLCVFQSKIYTVLLLCVVFREFIALFGKYSGMDDKVEKNI